MQPLGCKGKIIIMQGLFQKFFSRSAFLQNLLVLVSGNFIAQLLTLIFTFFLTRFFYNPSQFGVFSTYLALLSFPLALSTAKYDVAIVVSQNDEDAFSLLQLCLFVSGILSLLAALFVLLIYGFDLRFYSDSDLHKWLIFTPVTLFLLSGIQIFWMWQVRAKDFKILSKVRIIEAFVAGLSAILFFKMHTYGLLVANTLAIFLSFLILFFKIKQKSNPFTKISKMALLAVAKKYAEFPRMNILQGLLEMFQASAIIVIGAYFFNDISIGLYALCIRVLQAPIGLIIKPIAHVFFAEASERFRSGQSIYHLVLKTVKQSFLFSLPLFLIIGFFGSYLFSFFFGAKWSIAGLYAQIMSVYILSDLVKAPIAQVASVVGKQRQMVVYAIISNLILLLSLLLGGFYLKDLKSVLIIVSLTQTVFNILIILALVKMAKTTLSAL